MNMQDKLVCISGASSGIGEACARIFAQQKCNLILLARRIDRLNSLARKLAAEHSIQVWPVELDVRDNGKVKSVVDELPDNFKNIDILINNAGLASGIDKIQDGDINDWEVMIDTNIKGLLYLTRAILPDMIQRGAGHIINIGSIAGHEVYAKGNVYCATKHAVRALNQGMRIDTLGTGVRVTSVDPGLVQTEFSIVRFHGDKERAKLPYQKYTPLTADDVAETVLFCATRPKHVNINEIVVMPTAQASVTYSTAV